jgi:hypothetical protein
MFWESERENPRDLLHHLVDATGAWLHYKFLCRCEKLFNEGHLSYPIGEFLLSRCSEPFQVQCECPHPRLTAFGKRGPIDFAVIDGNDEVQVAIETKWLTLHQPSHAFPRVFGDILKLALLDCENAFLILAGNSGIIRHFFGQEAFCKAPGHLCGDTEVKGFLPIQQMWGGDQRLHVLPVAETADRKYFKKVKSKNTFAGVELPAEIVISAVPSYVGLKDIPGFAYDVYGWQVRPDPNSGKFKFQPS